MQVSTRAFVNELTGEALTRADSDRMTAVLRVDPPTGGIPTELSELNHSVVRAYDLTLTAAMELNIPVVGSVGGSVNRRVVVLERIAFKEITENQITYHYGYAVRLAITVSKLNADMKLSLPFLSASAEVGLIEGRWLLHVAGLAGPAIDDAILPAQELSVETFVLAKQSLASLKKAVHDAQTTFTAVMLSAELPEELKLRAYVESVAKAYALSRIEAGWSLRQAVSDLSAPNATTVDHIRETYQDFADISDEQSHPSQEVRRGAWRIMGPIKAESR